MARIRTIKPEFFTSDDIVSMTPLARLFYVSLWCEADRDGRLKWSPATFKMRYLPGDECDIDTLAAELIGRGLIVLYEANGRTFAEIPTFSEHQVINNREAASHIPPRTVDTPLTRESGVKVASVGEGKEGREGKGRERKEHASTREVGRFHEFWDAWPKSERKHDRKACAEKWVAAKLDSLVDAILVDIGVKLLTEKWRGGFIEAPVVYLQNRRWEDGVTPDGPKAAAETPYARQQREKWEAVTGRDRPALEPLPSIEDPVLELPHEPA